MEDLKFIELNTQHLAVLRDKIDIPNFSIMEKTQQLQDIITNLEQKQDYLKQTGLNTKYSPENVSKKNRHYRKAIQLQQHKRDKYRKQLEKDYKAVLTEDLNNVSKLPEYLGSKSFKTDILKNRNELLMKRIDVELWKKTLESWSIPRMMKSVARKEKIEEDNNRKKALADFSMMRQRRPRQQLPQFARRKVIKELPEQENTN